MSKNFYTIQRMTFGLSFFVGMFTSSIQAQNHSLLFDGTTERVTIPHHASYNRGAADFTVEAIVNISADNSTPVTVLSKRTSGTDGFIFYLYGNQMLVQMNGVPNYLQTLLGDNPNIFDNQCHHVAVSRVSTTLTFYLDGVAQGALTTQNQGINSTGPLHIGYDKVDDWSFKGSLTEVRFWNVARSATDINAYKNAVMPPAANGLIGLWRFNEASGQSIVDSSPTANNGVLGTNNTAESTLDPSRNGVCENSTVLGFFSGEESSSDKLVVAPNPFIGQTHVWLQDAPEGEYTAEVYTLDGLLLQRHSLNNKEEYLLGHDFSAGIYILKVFSSELIQTIRIEKK